MPIVAFRRDTGSRPQPGSIFPVYHQMLYAKKAFSEGTSALPGQIPTTFRLRLQLTSNWYILRFFTTEHWKVHREAISVVFLYPSINYIIVLVNTYPILVNSLPCTWMKLMLNLFTSCKQKQSIIYSALKGQTNFNNEMPVISDVWLYLLSFGNTVNIKL